MRSSGLRDTGVMLLGAGMGAGLMFLLDPQAGVRRRAMLRDQAVSFAKDAGFKANKRRQDFANRVRGQLVEWRQKVAEGPIENAILEQRARAQVGHVVSHPGTLEFEARDGVVIIAGPVLRGERERIEQRLRKTRGVRSWDLSGIEEHETAENIPGLQRESHHQRRVAS